MKRTVSILLILLVIPLLLTGYKKEEPVKKEDPILFEIRVTAEPVKKLYFTGENFDKSGMVVTAYYSNSAKKNVTTYVVEDGLGLVDGQDMVRINYTEGSITKSVDLNIKVQSAG